MDYLVVDLALHRLSKAVIDALKELEQPHRESYNDNLAFRFEQWYSRGEITKVEYLFLHSRILLNEFCYKIEDKIGKGCVCGFTFYSKEKHQLFYGAGANYPSILKEFLHYRTPTVDMDGCEQYGDREVFVLNDIDEWPNDRENYLPIFKELKVGTLISKRLRLNGITFGTFECYFPDGNRATDEVITLIRKEVQPIKEQIYHFREEMIQALTTMPQSLIINEKKSSSVKLFSQLAMMICGIPLYENSIYPLAGKLIDLI